MKSKIFFDGNCVVCDLEIAHYKKIAPEKFELVDISGNDFDARKYGLTKAAVDRHMHVLTPDGELKTGVEAFAHIWSRIDRYQTAASVIQWPVVHQLARFGYGIFVIIRPLLPKKH